MTIVFYNFHLGFNVNLIWTDINKFVKIQRCIVKSTYRNSLHEQPLDAGGGGVVGTNRGRAEGAAGVRWAQVTATGTSRV